MFSVNLRITNLFVQNTFMLKAIVSEQFVMSSLTAWILPSTNPTSKKDHILGTAIFNNNVASAQTTL